jgi:hypothetical protein
MKWFRKSPKNIFPEQKHVIEYAFTVGGKAYYKFKDHLNIPYERALSAVVYYREVDMNIDYDFLKQHLEAINSILTATTIDIFKIKALNDQLLTRLQLPKDPELMYKLASVVFFDKDESPEVYDWQYGKAKIEFWKKHASLTDFFLQMPLQELIPYLKFAGENLQTYSRIVADVNKIHSDKLSAMSLAKRKTNSNDKNGSSQVATPQN